MTSLATGPQHHCPTCPLCGGALPESGVLFLEASRTVIRGDASAHLRPKEAQIFAHLPRQAPKYVSRDRLMHILYGHEPDNVPFDHVLNTYLMRLRRRLAPLDVAIETIYGGYVRLESPVRVVEVSHA
jgi:DNA-binding response OmpR family regulator